MVVDERRPDVVSTLVAAGTITTGGMLPAMLLGALAVQMRDDLDFSNTELGAAVAAYFLLAALLSVQAGAWSDRLGTRVALMVAAASSVACLGATALVARSYPLLVVTLLIGPVAAAVSTPASNAVVAANMSGGRQGLAHGVKQAAIPVASLLAGLAVPAVGLTIGWRWGFGICAIVPVVGMVASWRATPPRTARIDRPRFRPASGSLREIRLAPLVWLSAGAGLSGCAVTSLTSFVVVASEEAGMSEGVAGAVVAGASAVVIAIRIGIGHLSDHRLGDRLKVVAAMQVAAAVGFALLATGQVAAMVVGTVLALAWGWGWTGLFTLAVVENHPEHQGVATGVAMTGVYAGGMVGPLVFALIEALASFALAWMATSAMAVGAAAAVMTARAGFTRSALSATSAPDDTGG